MPDVRWRHRVTQTTEPEQQSDEKPGGCGEADWRASVGGSRRGDRLGHERGLLNETAVQKMLMAFVVATAGGIKIGAEN